MLLCYDALRLKNTIQVIGICIFNLALLIYAAIQMDQIKDANVALSDQPDGKILRMHDIWPNIRPFLITIPCVIALSTILMGVVCWKLYDEFAWRIYKHISADLRMKKRYLTFQVRHLLIITSIQLLITPTRRSSSPSSSSTSFSLSASRCSLS